MKNKWKYLMVLAAAMSTGYALAQNDQSSQTTPSVQTAPSDQTTPSIQNVMPSDQTQTTSPTDQTTQTTTTTTTTTATSGVTFSDPSQTITVSSTSPTFVLTLQSNKTTGYSWFVKHYDQKLVKEVSHKYVPPQKAMPGAGGYEQFTFMLKPAAFTTPGTTTSIEMKYARPWEKKAGKVVTFNIATQ